MSRSRSLLLTGTLALSAATLGRADLAWLDFQGEITNPAPFHHALPALSGTVVTTGGVTYTLTGATVAARERVHEDAMLKDFAFADGEGASLSLRIAGLPAGEYQVDSWHFDMDYPGAVKIDLARVGDARRTLVPNHLFAAAPATYVFTADGTSTYELTFQENDSNNRVRLNGLRLRPAGTPRGLPGRFVDIDPVNTTATTTGGAALFFTDDPKAPGFLDGPLWRRRFDYGFDQAGNRTIFEKDANDGVGDALPLVTTVTGLPPGETYAAHVAYLSPANETWQVKAGLAPDALTLFSGASPADRVIDLGLSAESGSNRHQYLGFLGNVKVGADGTVKLHADDGDGTARGWQTRTWLEGFYLGAPALASTLPEGSVTVAKDGAWTWFNDERALVVGDFLYVGCVQTDGLAALARHNLRTGENHHVVLGTSASVQKDDHNNPSLTLLPDGRLLAVYSKHLGGAQSYQRISRVPQPATLADWGPETVQRTPANNTYANTHRLSGENNLIYNFHRSINFNPTLSLSDDLGATWFSTRQFIRSGTGGVRPYTRFASDGVGRIDVLYTDGHPRDVANSLYHLYYEGGQLRRTDDSTIAPLNAIPLDHDAGQRGSVIYQYRAEAWGPGEGPDNWIPTGRAWTWDIQRDAKGRPVVAFQVQRDDVTGKGWDHDRIYYYYAVWTGTEWQKRFIAHGGRPLYAAEDDYGGGMALDPEDPRVVYISSNAADPFKLGSLTEVPLRANERYELWRGFTADGGKTFTWTQLTRDSVADNLRPAVPEKHGREECVLWMHGRYSTYTDYSTRVIARIGPAKPVAKPAVVAPAPAKLAPVAPLAPTTTAPAEAQPAPSERPTLPGPRYPARR